MLNRFRNSMSFWAQSKAQNRAIAHLRTLSRDQLEDLGIERGDIFNAVRKGARV